MGVLTGATWTADRAHRRRLRGSAWCPYCGDQGASEDEDHLLWHCVAWDAARGTPRRKISMMLSRIPSLPGDVEQWPACLRLCGLPPRDLLGSVLPQLLKLFVDTLLDMFSAVLMARMLVEQREGAMFHRKLQPGQTYPYGELVGPLPKPVVADLLIVRDPPRLQ